MNPARKSMRPSFFPMPFPGCGYFHRIIRQPSIKIKLIAPMNLPTPDQARSLPEACPYSGLALRDEQNAILQRLSWETVSNFPYAGVAK